MNRTRSLAVKWTATLLLTSLVGVVLIGAFAYRATTSEYDRLRVDQAKSQFIGAVTDYYETNKSWEGCASWLYENEALNQSKYGSGYGYDQPPSGGPPPSDKYGSAQMFALADADGKIVIGHDRLPIGQQLTSQQVDEGIPITLNGTRIGTALLVLPPPDLDPREQRYLDSTNQALLVGAIGAGAAALLIGLLLSRHFLRPLTELTQAISAMRGGELAQQVQVRTKDELGDLAQTFNQMSAEIHRVNQLRKQMTADIAHDLRTPLMVISGYLEALRDGTLQPTPERFETMNQEATLLRRLIDDLRTLSLADAGELKLVYQSVQPQELLEQIRQSFEPIAQEQQVALKVQVKDNPPGLQVDRDRIMQVLANLVSNALRYTPAGGTVTLSARRTGDLVQLVVSDTGSGIPPDKLKNIFERFYRVESSRQESQGESGLGLAIAKSIVEAHQGTIAAESRVGVGTSMIITLRPFPATSS
jgi:signal transduction histidine kinase